MKPGREKKEAEVAAVVTVAAEKAPAVAAIILGAELALNSFRGERN